MPNISSALDFWFWPLRLGLGLGLGLGLAGDAVVSDVEIDWATPNEVAATTPTMRLRRFVGDATGDAPVLIVAPFAVHDAGIADLAPGHSLVATLAACGLGPIYLTEWKSATPAMAQFSIDAYLADLNVAVDLAGGHPAMVGLCQGGWLSLLYASVFPGKPRRLVVAGAPVDTSSSSSIADGARIAAPAMVASMIASSGGLVSGAETLAAFRASGGAETDAAEILQVERPVDDALHARYQAWDQHAVDLPGVYYTEVLNWLFRENRLALGSFPAFGRPAPLSQVTAPLYLLAGGRDFIAPPQQVRAAAERVGTKQSEIVYAQADCGHLSLFLGARTLRENWPAIAAWLKRG